MNAESSVSRDTVFELDGSLFNLIKLLADYHDRVLKKTVEHFEAERKAGHEIHPARPSSQTHGCKLFILLSMASIRAHRTFFCSRMRGDSGGKSKQEVRYSGR